MRNSTSSLLKAILASGTCAALALTGMLPAAARDHDNPHAAASSHTSVPARASAPAHAAAPEHGQRYTPPARVEAPVHYAAPQQVRHYAAPEHVQHYAAPAHIQHYTAPARVEAPTRYAAPAHAQHYAAPTRVQRAAPARIEAPVHQVAPARLEHAAPVKQERAPAPAPFEQRIAPQRVAPERNVHQVRETTTAPFMQVIRPARSAAVTRREVLTTHTFATSPLVRAVAASRDRAIPVVYHPRYVAGRVASVRNNVVVVDPPAGDPIVIRNVVVGSSAPVIPVGTYVTMPVTYTNGYYTYAPPVYADYNYNYDYGYAPQYQYAYAPPMYCNGDSSTALYAALLPAVVGMLTGSGSSYGSNDLSSLALTAATGGNNCVAYAPSAYEVPSYATPVDYGYSAPVSYSVPVPVSYAVTQATPYYAPAYAVTPYDTCLAGDEDGDESCAPESGYTYDNYSSYGAYTPQQLQGVVIGRSGDTLMVLGPGGTPTFVYAAPALQSGYTVNGPIQPGQIIDAYGYYSGNTFVATALV